MAKSIKFLVTLLVLSSLIFSCKKETFTTNEEIKNIVFDVPLQSGKLYTLDLNQYLNTNDLIFLSKQANSFQLSEIVNTENNKTYKFLKNTSLKINENKESVILRIYEPRNGIHCEKTDIIINFTIL
jgi:hypothetical protein